MMIEVVEVETQYLQNHYRGMTWLPFQKEITILFFGIKNLFKTTISKYTILNILIPPLTDMIVRHFKYFQASENTDYLSNPTCEPFFSVK